MIYQLAITINQQGTRDGWLREVAEWLQACDKITKLIASEEVGSTGVRHLQCLAETKVGAQQLRIDIHKRFLELRGEKSHRGQKMSIAMIRTSWERNVAYCLKDDGVRYTKGVEDDDLLEWRDRGQSEAKRDKKDTPSWNEQLRIACVKAHARSEEDIGQTIVMWYLGLKKTVPDDYQLARLITTIELMISDQTVERKIRDLVRRAVDIKNHTNR